MTASEVFRSMELFSGLTDEDIQLVISSGAEQSMVAGGVVFKQGDAGDAFYVVLDGAVKITTETQGHDLEICTDRRGEYFGELALIDGAPRSATATVSEPGRLFKLARASCTELLARSPQLLYGLLARFAQNLRASTFQRAGLSLEKEALRTQGELERLRALSQMVAGVAHEINTPLGIIQNAASLVTEILTPGAVEDLAQNPGGALALGDVAAACALIQKNAAHAARLVQSFKSLSVRQITDAREVVDLLSVVRDVLDLYRLKAKAAHLDIRIECALGPAERSWDGFPGYLSQVLLNLITNVERYAYPDGKGGVVEITVSHGAAVGRVPCFELMVRDHGCGIAPEHLPKIFEPFFTTGRSLEGTGLGLAIVHNIVTGALGGTLRVESVPSFGAAFHVGFPRIVPQGAGT